MKPLSSGHAWHGPLIFRSTAITPLLRCATALPVCIAPAAGTSRHPRPPFGRSPERTLPLRKEPLMSYLLHIDSSALGEASISRHVADSFLDHWDGTVVHPDPDAAPVRHPDAAGGAARETDPAAPAEGQSAAVALQDSLLEDFLGARAYLFTVPMYNLTVPSVFK